MSKICFLVMTVVLATYQVATASPITVTYSFDVGGFTPTGGVETQISGSFTTTFEPITGNGINVSTLDAIGLSINGINYTPANTQLIVQNAMVDTDHFSGRFEIGGTANGGVYGGGNFSDDFNLFFTDSGNPVGFSNETFRYTFASSNGFFDASTFEISRSSVVIPEPSSLLLALTTSVTLIWLRSWRLSV